MKIKRKKKLKIGFRKCVNKSVSNKRTKHPTKSRTDDEEKDIRKFAYRFMFLKSLGDWKKLEELGYEERTDLYFCQQHELSDDYLSAMVHRDFFKQEYFDYVTNCISRDFAEYLVPTLYKGKEKVKAMQIILPEQVGKALTQRKIGLLGDNDDEEFRNEFFGMSKPTGEEQ